MFSLLYSFFFVLCYDFLKILHDKVMEVNLFNVLC